MFLAWPHGLIFFFKTLIIAGDYPVVWISDSLCVFVRLFCLTGSNELAFTSPLCREDTLDHLPSLLDQHSLVDHKLWIAVLESRSL